MSRRKSTFDWQLACVHSISSVQDPCSYRCMNAKINFREKEKQILDQILGPGRYDARIRPSGINGTGKSTK